MLIRINMGDNKIGFLAPIISKLANFKPSVGKDGTSLRFLSVNLIGIGRFV
jgi:hypothetical protein